MRFKRFISGIIAGVVLAMSVIMTPMSAEAAPTELPQACLGIDVSRYQGLIDWSQVAAFGVQFAMVRIGTRTASTGIVQEDEYARYNLQEANKYGIKVGAYFYSTAVTSDEAIAEANYVCDILDGYNITFPVAYDCENYNKKTSRQYLLNKAQRTSLAMNFMDTVAARGYNPMFYGNRSAMLNNKDWNMDTIASKYKVWVAYYPALAFPTTPDPGYTGIYHMWQYTQKMLVPGITEYVDFNVSYFNYSEIAAAKNPASASSIASPNNTQYTPVCDYVTSTTSVNIRTEASTQSASIGKLTPGVPVVRAGLGNNGWSQVIINNQIFYISSKYLTIVK